MNAYGKALEHARICNNVWQDYIDYSLNAGPGIPINWVELVRLAERSNDADRELMAIMKDVQNQPCTCDEHTGSVCAPCYADNIQRYGDDIPIGG